MVVSISGAGKKIPQAAGFVRLQQLEHANLLQLQ
jgi:hypothetical protein